MDPRLLIGLLGALVALTPFAIDTYLPGLPAIARDLAASEESVQWTISIYLLGFGLGMLIYGPIGDRFGRRPVLLSGIVLFALASLGCIWVTDIEQLIALRLIQAISGGAASVMPRAIARDVFSDSESARVLTLIAMVTALAPLVAPGIGGQILLYGDWRDIFTALTVLGVAGLLASWAWIPESMPAEKRGAIRLGAAFLAYRHILVDGRALGYIVGGGAMYRALFAYITGTPFVYIEHFGVAPEWYGAFFAANIAFQLLVSYVNTRFVKRLGIPRISLIAAAVAAAGGTLLLLAGWTGFAGLWGVVLPLLPIVGVIAMIGANCTARLMALYPDNAGAVAATVGGVMFAAGATASFAVGALHDGTPKALCAVLFAVCATAFLGLWFAVRREAGEV